MPLEHVFLTELSRHESLQMRAEENVHQRQVYKEHLVMGGNLPPIKVFRDDDRRLWCADGWHRVGAALDAGLEIIAAEVTPGTRRDAWLYALGANAEHGLPRTQADKRRAVLAALTDPELVTQSDRKIALLCKVSHPFVAKMRAELHQPERDVDGPAYDPFGGVTDPVEQARLAAEQSDPLMLELMIAAHPEWQTKNGGHEFKRQLSALQRILRCTLHTEIALVILNNNTPGVIAAAVSRSAALADRPAPEGCPSATLRACIEHHQILGVLAQELPAELRLEALRLLKLFLWSANVEYKLHRAVKMLGAEAHSFALVQFWQQKAVAKPRGVFEEKSWSASECIERLNRGDCSELRVLGLDRLESVVRALRYRDHTFSQETWSALYATFEWQGVKLPRCKNPACEGKAQGFLVGLRQFDACVDCGLTASGVLQRKVDACEWVAAMVQAREIDLEEFSDIRRNSDLLSLLRKAATVYRQELRDPGDLEDLDDGVAEDLDDGVAEDLDDGVAEDLDDGVAEDLDGETEEFRHYRLAVERGQTDLFGSSAA